MKISVLGAGSVGFAKIACCVQLGAGASALANADPSMPKSSCSTLSMTATMTFSAGFSRFEPLRL
jgi:hypothetical protein